MKRLLIFLLVCIAITRFPLITGCANMLPPTGGPKDTLAPVLVNALPAMRTLHENSNKIVLNFDEYIDLKDIRTQLIVNPVPKVMPTVTSHLRTITISLRDTLQPNTTYSLNFGRAVTDVNEGNVLKNFTYVFSTGNYIDSLTYSGRVVMANTGRPDSNLIVMLHYQLFDSAVAKMRPRYIARLDSSGNFTFRHVRPDIYALYALEDQSGTHEYTSPGQIFAFADSAVDLRKSTAPLLLYAYQDTSGFKKPTPPKATPKAPTKKEKKEEKERVKRIIISGNISNGMLDLHNPFEMSFATPIISFDSSKIVLTGDSFQNVTNYHFTLDSTNKKLTLHYALKPNTGYHLILQKDFATDSLDDKLLKVDTIAFRTKKESDYAILRLRFKNLDLNRHPVLLFIQGDKIILSYKIGKSLRYNNKLFDPGEYEVRILYDTNQNGVWDPGDFYHHIQPEIVIPLRKKFYVKTGWENEEDIIL